MKQKVVKITIIFLLLQPIWLMILLITGTTIDRNMYTEEYKDFYIHKFDYKALSLGFDFGTGNNAPRYTKIWFLPSQKEKLLNKIKEDVNEILTEIQVTNENVTVDYEISDDFKEVMIYIDNEITYRAYHVMYEMKLREEIGMRVVLYHELLQDSDSPYYGDVVRFIYTGSEPEMGI
jgi:hypothetical protein